MPRKFDSEGRTIRPTKTSSSTRRKHNNAKHKRRYDVIVVVCLCCSSSFEGNLHRQTGRRKKIKSKGLTQHLNAQITLGSAGQQHFDLSASSALTRKLLSDHRHRNCYSYYESENLVNPDGSYDLTTSLPGNLPAKRVNYPNLLQGSEEDTKDFDFQNTFGIGPSSKVLEFDCVFAPKEKFKTAKLGHSISIINDSLLNRHFENSLSRRAIEDYYVARRILGEEEDVEALQKEEYDGATEEEDPPTPTTHHAVPTNPDPKRLANHDQPRKAHGFVSTPGVRDVFVEMLDKHVASEGHDFATDPYLRMEVDLLRLCQHYKLPLSAVEDFQIWARKAVRNSPQIFERPICSRAKVLEICRSQLGLRADNEFHEHIIHWLPENKPTKIYIRSLLKTVFDLLMDPDALGEGGCNIRLPDPDNPYRRKPTHRPERVGELCDGKWWRETMKMYCTKEKEILIPLIFACDKSLTDINSRLTVTPFLVTLGIFSIQTRKNINSWRVLTHLLDDDAESNRQRKIATPEDKIQNLHNSLKIVLKELQDLHDSGDSIRWELEYGGKLYEVRIKLAICYVISDSEMHNKLCGSYGSFDSMKLESPCRMCDTPGEYLIDPSMFAASNLYVPQRLLHHPSFFREDADFRRNSQHRIENAWYGKPWGANRNEIHVGASPENLHVVEKGAQKRCVESLLFVVNNASRITFAPHKSVARRDTNIKKTIRDLEYLGRRYGVLLSRHSERDKPRTVFGNGLFADTKKTAKEQAGVCLSLLLAMLSDQGRRILLENRGIHENFLQKIVLMFERCLMLGQWLKKESYPSSHACNQKKMGRVIDDFVRLLACTCARSGNGAILLKNHLIMHYPLLLFLYGPPIGWDSGPIECFHKSLSKLPAQLTQRIQRVFQQQLASRTSEIDVINAMISRYNEIEETYVYGEEAVPLDNVAGSKFYVGYNDAGESCIKWSLKKNDNKPGHFPPVVQYVCSEVLPRIDANEVPGFTEYKTIIDGQRTIFRSHPSFNANSGQECNMWYDWAKIRYANDTVIPGRIFMFIRLSGLNSPIAARDGGVTIEATEDTIELAVVQMFRSKPTSEFRDPLIKGLASYSSLVEYGRLKDHLELVPCERIVGAAIVVPNIGYSSPEDEDEDEDGESSGRKRKMKPAEPTFDSQPLGSQVSENGEDEACDDSDEDTEASEDSEAIDWMAEESSSNGFFVVSSRTRWGDLFEELIEEDSTGNEVLSTIIEEPELE